MAPIPAPAPTSPTAYTAPFTGQGGGNQFVASGPCSGTAWTHSQDLAIFYEVVLVPQGGGSWPPSTTNVSALKITSMGNAETALAFFSTSSVSGATGCATAADARQGHVLALSSTDSAVGMGTKGAIYTLSAGYERRWTRAGDTTVQDNRYYVNGIFEIAGLPENWNTNADLSNTVSRQIIARVANGGLQYNNDGVTPAITSSNWPLMDFSLMDV